MANLTDSIRLNTEVDLNGLINLIQEFKDLNIKVKDVAAASRALTEQIKRDNLEQVNSVKLSILEHGKLTAELINEGKVEEQASKTHTANSNKKIAETNKESAANKKLVQDLLQDDVIKQAINATEISNSNKKAAAEKAITAEKQKNISTTNQYTAAINQGTAAINQGAAATRQEIAIKQLSASTLNQGTAIINQGTAATRQSIAEKQLEKETVRISTEQQKLYNVELRNKALESKNAQKSTDGLFSSLSSLSSIRSGLVSLFGLYSIGDFAQQMINAQSTVQAFGLSMKNLIGNAYGEKLVNDLKQFTVNTPLNFEEVIKSTNQLVGSFKAAGASSKTIGTEIPQILESIGNSAAALGGDDRMGRLIYAFSQVQATGRLMGTEVRQITETGFPMLAVLTQSLNERFPKLALSVSDVQKRVSDGKVSFDDFKIALLSAGQAGGVFAGGMEARMATVAGSLDKLKESTFFALANIGNQFNVIAKQVIDFGSSIIKTLFGTESAAQRTVEIVSNLTKIYLVYRTAVAAVATATALKDAYDKVSLITQGLLMRSKALLNGESQKFITLMAEETLAKNINTGATVGTTAAIEVMTVAEAEAAIATRSLTAAFGVIAIVLGVAYAAYEIYKSTIDDTNEKQKELNERMALGIAPIRESQSEFNRLANALKNSSDATQEKTTKLEALKAKFPEQLKGINDLANAEKLLGDKAKDTNIVKDYRLKLFNELKTKFPEQVKGLKDVNYSETELSKIMKEVNGDFLIRQQLMKDEIALNMNKEKINIWLKEQIKLEGELATASTKSTYMVTGTAGNVKEIASERSEIEQAIAARGRWVLNAQQTNSKIVANSIETTKKLKFNWEEQTGDANKAGEEDKEKALKYKAETIAQGKIMDEIAFRKELETSRENENTIRTLQKTYDDSRLKDAIGTQKQKLEAQKKLDHDFNNDMADLKRKWNAKEKAEAIKAEKEKNREIESEAKKSAERMWDEIVRRIDDEQKEKEKAAQEDKKFQEEVVKETIKIKDSEQKLKDKLLLLEKLSKAKNSKDILNIEEQLSKDIATQAQDRTNKEISSIKEKLDYLKSIGQEQTDEYRRLYKTFLDLQNTYNNEASALAAIEVEALKKSIKQKEDIFKGLVDATKSIVNSIFDDMESSIDDAISKTDNSLDKFFLNRKKKDLKEIKDFVSIAGKAVSGDIAGAVSGAVVLVYDLVKNTMSKQADWEKAVLERQTQLYKEYAKTAKASIAALLTDISSVTNVYENIIPKSFINVKDGSNQYLTVLQYQYKVLQSQSKELDTISEKLWTRGNAVDSFIKKEVAYAESIKSLYQDIIKDEKDRHEKAIDFLNKEFETSNKQEIDYFNVQKDNLDKLYNDKIKSINDAYNEEVRLINAKFDLESTRANQKYDKETLAILQAGSKQLEALITNEISLNSVRTEFAGKRQFILDSYALANKTITADMSEEEIAGINNAIKARDEALAKLQRWYNDELTFIVNSEGQKRKEYTATELIANGVAYRLEQAAIAFNAAEIARNANKNAQLAAAAASKKKDEEQAKTDRDKSIEDLEKLHKANMTAIDNAYQLAIRKEQDLTKANLIKINGDMERDLTASYNRLINALSGEISRYASLLTSINDKTTEEYKALQTELQILIDKYKELTGVLPTITTTEIPAIVRQPRGFEKGTDDTSVSLKGQRVVDNKGGWQAILHPQEAVFSKADMTQMETVFGKRPTRQEVIENFKIGVVNQVTPQMNPFVIQKVQANGVGNFDKLGDKIERLAKEVSKKMSPVVYVDKGGIRTYYKNLNSQIEVKNQRFK